MDTLVLPRITKIPTHQTLLKSDGPALAMSDDGLLLNFSASDAPSITKPSFTGGRWKDRLTAKKLFSNWQKKQASTPELEGHTSKVLLESESLQPAPSDLSDRPSKRRRTEKAVRDRTVTNGHGSEVHKNSEANKPTHQSNQFVSSLFTSNPKPRPVSGEDYGISDEKQIAPSNAPLTSELENFTSLGLSPILANHLLNKLEIKSPTAIQKQAIAHLVKEDTDAFIQAETGSGKTLAYILPIIQRLMGLSTKETPELETQKDARIHRDSGLFALILAPTRELCKQISVVLESLLRCAHWIVSGNVAGGESKKSEKARLRKGLNILVATPGRLVDHLANTKVLDVSRVKWLILDEGDRLVELGFEKDVQKIVSNLNLQSRRVQKAEIAGLPDKRITVLCSATMKMEVQRLGDCSLKDPTHIQVHINPDVARSEIEKREKDMFAAPAQLKQSYAIIPAKLRLVSLVAALQRAFARKGSVTKAIVFLSCADSVDFHFELLTRDESTIKDHHEFQIDSEVRNRSGASANLSNPRTSAMASTLSTSDNPVEVFRLHGSLPQFLRTDALSRYSKGSQAAVLLCTDVASRGLDLPNVDLVMEYDPAFCKDDHLHRVGRTARAGRNGRALIFLMPGDEENYVQILKQGRREGTFGIVRHDAGEILQRGFGNPLPGPNSKSREWEARATECQLDAERWVQQSLKNLEQARKAFQSHVRAYATHVIPERHCFDIKALHLGHLAKAFALRDKPGALRVPGLRPGKVDLAKSKFDRKMGAGISLANETGDKSTVGRKSDSSMPAAVNAQDAARRMQAKMKQMSGAAEFNLG